MHFKIHIKVKLKSSWPIAAIVYRHTQGTFEKQRMQCACINANMANAWKKYKQTVANKRLGNRKESFNRHSKKRGVDCTAFKC